MFKDEMEKLYGEYAVFDRSGSNQASINLQLEFAFSYHWKDLDSIMSNTKTISESKFLKLFYRIMDLKIYYKYILEEVLQKKYGFKIYGISTSGSGEKIFINPKYLPRR